MAVNFSSEDVLERFDKLAALNIIQHGPSEAISLVDDHFPFEFRICPSWAKKPMTVDAALPTDQDAAQPELFGPGSDIYKSHPDQVIGTINDTHVLALNIYPVFRPQYILLSLDSYQSQNDPLDLQDIQASWEALHRLPSPHYIMYNCTRDAGCSRHHKHTQIMPKPEGADSQSTGFGLFPDKSQDIQVPYVYFVHHFNSTGNGESVSSETVFEVYKSLLEKCKEALGISTGDSVICPHNLVLVKEWMVMIPRRRGNFAGASANAAGMMGMPTLTNRGQFKIWTDLGPAKALGELGVSKE
ncbi:phosphorylase [Penicillium capsulatum]|uniref:Phosphorylase n=1 Tax=Penicillium capsulatum TaxID=69766 RepID=A0A9W9IL47_9EURO|nr:phosphorylase [Penicillium capsulatum]